MNTMVNSGYSKNKASMLTGISRSMLYYERVERSSKYNSELESRIIDIAGERPSYGTRRITAMLKRRGINTGRNRVRRHMRHLKLVKLKTYNRRVKRVPRAIIVSKPDTMWETDITKIYINNDGWAYFTAYIDLCSRKVKGHLASRMSRTQEMMEALDNAVLSVFTNGKTHGLILRSDNGSQLTSSRFEKHLKDYGISHETIHAHTPEEDGHIESYFGRFKDDYIYTGEFSSFEEFKNYIDWAVNDYNTNRPHSSLDYLTPEEFEIAIKEEEFKRKYIEKKLRRYKYVELL